jgi:hypothetical protein
VCVTVSALAFKDYIGEQRYVVIPSDCTTTGRTSGTRGNNRNMPWQSPDAYVSETTASESENKAQNNKNYTIHALKIHKKKGLVIEFSI